MDNRIHSSDDDDNTDYDDEDETAAAAMIAMDGSLQTLSQADAAAVAAATASPTRPDALAPRPAKQAKVQPRGGTERLRPVPTDPAFCAAVVFLALKREGVPRTLRELAQRMGLKQALIKRGYHLLSDYCPVTPADRTDAASLVERFCSRLGVGYSVVTRARKLAEELSRSTMHGRSPTTIAVGAVYLSLDPADTVSRDPSVLAAASSGNASRISRLLAELDRMHHVVVAFAPTPTPSPHIATTPQQ